VEDFEALERLGEKLATDFVPIGDIVGDDEVDTKLLRKMAADAERYIAKFSWCQEILESYFANGVGGIFAVFFFRVRSDSDSVSPWIWIMVGDLPSAFLPISDCKSDAEAFRLYCWGMSNWVDFARKGQTGTTAQGVPPVNVPSTPEWAEVLKQRLDSLREIVAPFFGEDSELINSIRMSSQR